MRERREEGEKKNRSFFNMCFEKYCRFWFFFLLPRSVQNVCVLCVCVCVAIPPTP